ncbi:MAG: peptidylprolyl isomerase [Thiomicrospira sp.]|jgi:FKBP-type peptidyl-prolyl cis-trans isomerase SlyD|nr:peptidylprolyl isomerase [Thiomicrospira sp.]
MKIEQDKVVQIEYTLKDHQGEVMDASDGEPLAYLHGHHNLIPGLEAALEGKQVGDNFSVTVAAAEGYGEIDPALIQQVPSHLFEGVENLEVGMRFEAHAEHGVESVVIAAIEGDLVTVNANHPLAGHDLTFDVEVVAIRDASEEELEHGHAHGVGGHHH